MLVAHPDHPGHLFKIDIHRINSKIHIIEIRSISTTRGLVRGTPLFAVENKQKRLELNSVQEIDS